MNTIDYSEMRTFFECGQKHYYQYVLGLEPNKPQEWSVLGTAIHAGLSAHHMGSGNPLTAYTQSFEDFYNGTRFAEEDRKALLDLYWLGTGMLTHYLEHYKNTHDFELIVSEFPFLVPIPGTDGAYQGRVDGIITDRNGEYWILEHKTATKFPEPAYFTLDQQSLKYQWAVQQLITAGAIPEVLRDVKLAGYCYNGLLKRIPGRPELLKSGKGLSKAAIVTTHDTYLDEVVKRGFLPEDYEDMLAKLREQGNVFFKREWWRRTDYELRVVAWRLQMEYVERFRPNRPILPHITHQCASCAYYEPCVLTQRGGDVQDMLQRAFHQKGEPVSPGRGTV